MNRLVSCCAFDDEQRPAHIADRSWIDVQQQIPINPCRFIKNAALNNTDGVLINSTTYAHPSGKWASCTWGYSQAPSVTAVRTDDAEQVADASQWNAQHLTWFNDETLAPTLLKRVYLRAGREWRNTLEIDIGATAMEDFQLGLLINAGTRGDSQGTIPVVGFPDLAVAGVISLEITFAISGVFMMGLRANNGADWYMFETEWHVVE